MKYIKNESGLSLMELMIAMVLITIIGMAAFAGLQYAYTILASSREFMEETYDAQLKVEEDLTLANLGDSFAAGDVGADSGLSPTAHQLAFTWNTSGSTLDGVTYTVDGYTVETDAEGGSYLDTTIRVYIPTNQVTK